MHSSKFLPPPIRWRYAREREKRRRSPAPENKIQIIRFQAQCHTICVECSMLGAINASCPVVKCRCSEGWKPVMNSPPIYTNRPRFPPPFVPSLELPMLDMSKNSGRLSFRFVPPAKLVSRFVDRVLCRVLLCLFCILAALFTISTLREPGLCEGVASEGGSFGKWRSLDEVSDVCIWTSRFGKGCAAEKVNMDGRSMTGE